jgi:hypothetical protein
LSLQCLKIAPVLIVFVDGASNTDTFVNFFFEAGNSVSENGFPALEPGDLVIVDNCSNDEL